MASLHEFQTMKIHPKNLIVIPKEARKMLGLRIGDRLKVRVKNHSFIELVPLKHTDKNALEKSYGAFPLKKEVDIVKAVEESITKLADE